MKRMMALALLSAFTLTGCVVSESEQPSSNSGSQDTETTETRPSLPEPEIVEEELIHPEDFGMTDDEMFRYLLETDLPSWMLEGEAFEILKDQALTTCEYIRQGDSAEDILWILTMAQEGTDVSQEVEDAFLSATVASTFTYCSEYDGFFE